jgi:hypothetical protein
VWWRPRPSPRATIGAAASVAHRLDCLACCCAVLHGVRVVRLMLGVGARTSAQVLCLCLPAGCPRIADARYRPLNAHCPIACHAPRGARRRGCAHQPRRLQACMPCCACRQRARVPQTARPRATDVECSSLRRKRTCVRLGSALLACDQHDKRGVLRCACKLTHGGVLFSHDRFRAQRVAFACSHAY